MRGLSVAPLAVSLLDTAIEVIERVGAEEVGEPLLVLVAVG